MSDFNSEFVPALAKPGAWKVGDSQYDEGGKYLKLSLPLESVHQFCSHLMKMADDSSKVKQVKTWNAQAKTKEEVPGIEISFKGRDGEYGSFGNINPALIADSEPEPF